MYRLSVVMFPYVVVAGGVSSVEFILGTGEIYAPTVRLAGLAFGAAVGGSAAVLGQRHNTWLAVVAGGILFLSLQSLAIALKSVVPMMWNIGEVRMPVLRYAAVGGAGLAAGIAAGMQLRRRLGIDSPGAGGPRWMARGLVAWLACMGALHLAVAAAGAITDNVSWFLIGEWVWSGAMIMIIAGTLAGASTQAAGRGSYAPVAAAGMILAMALYAGGLLAFDDSTPGALLARIAGYAAVGAGSAFGAGWFVR